MGCWVCHESYAANLLGVTVIVHRRRFLGRFLTDWRTTKQAPPQQGSLLCFAYEPPNPVSVMSCKASQPGPQIPGVRADWFSSSAWQFSVIG